MDDLDGPVRRALHDARLDLSLEFRRGPDGSKRGALLIAGASGETVARVPLESPEAMNVALARLVQLGFTDTAAPPPPLPQAETSVLVAGVDGYRKGWVAVALDPSGDVQVSTHASFSEVLSSQARVIAVDIPVDPPGLGGRPADAGARAFVGGSRASSVFPTPPRAALEARTFAEANERARTITGRGISQQAFALAHKILEVHALAEVDERVIEMHPEVSFRELAGEPVLESKHGAAGLARRRELLAAAGIVLPGAVPGVPEADLLDAAAGAWTAARYAEGRAQPFPPGHPERLGAIWR
jgi:predicted RNase H-like nuclease